MSGIQYRRSTICRKRCSVSSGVRVRTIPSRLAMRWTCVSTGIAGIPYPNTRTQLAVFGPTPGSEVSSSSVRGTSLWNRSRISREIARITRDLTR
ncbi:MAG: hypothetical protein WAN74_01290 [Thermoplasmata archaeon]